MMDEALVQKARELLAAEYAKAALWFPAESVVDGSYMKDTPADCAIRAITRALQSRPADALEEVEFVTRLRRVGRDTRDNLAGALMNKAADMIEHLSQASTRTDALEEDAESTIRAAIMRALEQADQTSNSHDWIANEAMESVRAALPQALTRTDALDGWQDIATAPHAMTVMACRFDSDVGEWVYNCVLSPPSHPFTHWRPLQPPPAGCPHA